MKIYGAVCFKSMEKPGEAYSTNPEALKINRRRAHVQVVPIRCGVGKVRDVIRTHVFSYHSRIALIIVSNTKENIFDR